MNLLPYLFSAVEEPIRYSLAAFELFSVLHPLTPIAEPQSDFDYPGALDPDIMHTHWSQFSRGTQHIQLTVMTRF
jgi:hypothetical protein